MFAVNRMIHAVYNTLNSQTQMRLRLYGCYTFNQATNSFFTSGHFQGLIQFPLKTKLSILFFPSCIYIRSASCVIAKNVDFTFDDSRGQTSFPPVLTRFGDGCCRRCMLMTIPKWWPIWKLFCHQYRKTLTTTQSSKNPFRHHHCSQQFFHIFQLKFLTQ